MLFSLVLFLVCFFFFSSRRRHTRCLSDWSSDVCSSDLACCSARPRVLPARLRGRAEQHALVGRRPERERQSANDHRSEERRVGKECRARWWPYHEKKKTEEDEVHGDRKRESRQRKDSDT